MFSRGWELLIVVLGNVGTISVDLKEMCKQTATREEILGEVFMRCRYLVGIGFGVGGLSLFALKIRDTWGRTEVRNDNQFTWVRSRLV